MAPPELARDAPVLDIAHPLVVGVDPLLGYELDRTAVYRVNRFLCDGFTGRVFVADFIHRYKPLVSEHGLYHLASAGADGQHELVGLDFEQQAVFF